jgi:hypothetical protein
VSPVRKKIIFEEKGELRFAFLFLGGRGKWGWRVLLCGGGVYVLFFLKELVNFFQEFDYEINAKSSRG